ncbi:torsin-1A-interacting protein 2-like [Pempheris klunzingeri]|uniref:torsin-1A-interacting protein 2-like n=1 Tax=Pempheris klunzingeri TaxID=3127111 RepID=UPI00397F8C8F
MAEQDTHQHTPEVRDEETLSTNMMQVPSSDEHKQEEAFIAPNVKQQLSEDSSASTNGETKMGNGAELEQADIKNDGSAEETVVPLTEGSPSLDEASNPPQADDGSHGDYNREPARTEQLTTIGEDISNDVNRLRTDLAPEEEDDMQEDTASSEEISAEDGKDGQRNTVEAIGPTTQDTTEPTDPVVSGSLGDDGSAEETVAPLTEGSPSLDEASNPPQADDGSHGDYNREPARTEQPTTIGEDISRDCHTGEKKAPETTAPLTPGVREEDRVDGPKARPKQETSGNNKSNTNAGENDVNRLRTDLAPEEEDDMQEDTASSEEISAEDGKDGQRNTVETIGPTTQDTTEPTDPVVSGSLGDDGSAEETVAPLTEGSPSLDEASNPPQADDGSHGDYNREPARTEQPTTIGEDISRDCHTGEKKAPETTAPLTPGVREEDRVDGPKARPKQETSGSRRYLLAVGVAVVVAILVQYLLQPESPPQKKDVRQIDIFLKQMDKLKTQFPNQRAELWTRSRIHMLRHLQMAQPTEPVSLILTAGLRAERTLHCMAQGLASAFSLALNASILHIDGASKASQDSDQVKLEIDSKLQGAFEGDKPVAVIHRFEELPPGSTLIFYRYCDHENAAYKKTCLIFTVLLEDEEETLAKSHLSTVEEMVDDHLQKKFLSSGHPVSFDRMDLDKYSGLWSRISHLILPVTADERIEHEGCEGT